MMSPSPDPEYVELRYRADCWLKWGDGPTICGGWLGSARLDDGPWPGHVSLSTLSTLRHYTLATHRCRNASQLWLA
jgi:hypothetical protein